MYLLNRKPNYTVQFESYFLDISISESARAIQRFLKGVMNEFLTIILVNIPNKEPEEDIHTGYSDECPLIDPGSKKIPKVGWRVREACYHKLYEVLGEFMRKVFNYFCVNCLN